MQAFGSEGVGWLATHAAPLNETAKWKRTRFVWNTTTTTTTTTSNGL